jgi:hypothetical protein
MKGFTWVKLNQLAEQHINKALQAGGVEDFYDFLDLLNAQTRMNGGNYTRANTEDMLIATRGNGLERKNASVKQVIYSPLVNIARSQLRRVSVWKNFTVMFSALSCSAVAARLAGTAGATNAKNQR